MCRQQVFFTSTWLCFLLLSVDAVQWHENAHLNQLDLDPKELMKGAEDMDCMSNPDGICDFSRADASALAKRRSFSDLGTASLQFRNVAPLTCGCTSKNRLLDLGYQYYPRYLPTTVCTSDSCGQGGARCKQRFYKIRVLRRKDQDVPEQEVNTPNVPESLKNEWIFEGVRVAVACVCTASK